MHRRTFAVLAGVAAACVAATAWAVAPSPHHVTSAPETRLDHFYETGPGSSCDGDACGIGEPRPVAFRLPASSRTYSGTIVVSLGYTTTGDGFFALSPRVTDAGTLDDRGTLSPVARVLPPTRYRTATTVAYRVTDIPADTALELHLAFRIGERQQARTSIGSRNVLVELRVAPG